MTVEWIKLADYSVRWKNFFKDDNKTSIPINDVKFYLLLTGLRVDLYVYLETTYIIIMSRERLEDRILCNYFKTRL